MTKQYLTRVLDSFTRNFGPLDEDEMREYITRNADELAKPAHVEKKLDLFDVPHSKRVLMQFVLEAILNHDDCASTERDLAEAVQGREAALVEEALSDEALKYADGPAVDILQTVLEVAFEDDEVSRDEYRLIRRLREKLALSRKQQRIIEARLGVFPSQDRQLHDHEAIRDAVKELERRGVLFFCNRAEGGPLIVLPQEIQDPVKQTLDVELRDDAKRFLWENLSNAHLQTILRAKAMQVSGSKDDLVARLMRSEVKPSEGLDLLMNDELYNICDGLPGVRVSGAKQDRVERIIRHFDRLVVSQTAADADPAERYYEFFVQLACRDRENLLANKIISKDLHMEHAFEAATTWLFNVKLEIPTMSFKGSDHPDGCATFKDGTLLYWDNKSKESVYDFPAAHVTQFKRYIRDSETRVNCFMVIVPSVDMEKAEPTCMRTKVESQSDTDICVITAEDLKWVAEHWREYSRKGVFDLNVFNLTGILDRRRLEQTMKLFL